MLSRTGSSVHIHVSREKQLYYSTIFGCDFYAHCDTREPEAHQTANVIAKRDYTRLWSSLSCTGPTHLVRRPDRTRTLQNSILKKRMPSARATPIAPRVYIGNGSEVFWPLDACWCRHLAIQGVCVYVCVRLQKYNNCSCVVSETGGGAMEGKCMSECQLLTMFLVIFAFIIFVTFTTSMPALAATLRLVAFISRTYRVNRRYVWS